MDEQSVRVAYIAGWGRSGSTLLNRMIARTPGYIGVGEMRDIWQRGCLENRLCGCGEPFASCQFWGDVGAEAFGGWKHVDAQLLNRLRRQTDGLRYLPWLVGAAPVAYENRLRLITGALSRLYRAIATVSGARVIVDSSKISTYAMLLHRSDSLDVHAVHLVRDSRGVVFSWQKRMPRADSPTTATEYMRTYSTAGACARYTTHNLVASALPRAGIPYMRVRYEDLVSDPAATLRSILEALDPDVRPCLNISTEDPALAFATDHSVDGNPMRLKGSVQLRADIEWMTAMRNADRRTVTAMTYPMLRKYGYPSMRSPSITSGEAQP